MSEELFQVVYRGKILTGFTTEQVRASLANLFKTDEARVAAQLALPKWVIKAGINKGTAQQIQEKLRGLGMMVAIMADDNVAQIGATSASPSAIPGAVAPVVSAPSIVATIASSGLEAPDRTLDPNDQPLATRATVQAYDPDLSAYSLAEVGALMSDSTAVTKAEKQYNLSQFTLAEVGAQIVEKQAIKPAQIDTSEMSLAAIETNTDANHSALWREMES